MPRIILWQDNIFPTIYLDSLKFFFSPTTVEANPFHLNSLGLWGINPPLFFIQYGPGPHTKVCPYLSLICLSVFLLSPCRTPEPASVLKVYSATNENSHSPPPNWRGVRLVGQKPVSARTEGRKEEKKEGEREKDRR